jgi:hypothetical protein
MASTPTAMPGAGCCERPAHPEPSPTVGGSHQGVWHGHPRRRSLRHKRSRPGQRARSGAPTPQLGGQVERLSGTSRVGRPSLCRGPAWCLVCRVSTSDRQRDFSLHQFLIDGEEPLLFHTGMRQLFPPVAGSVASIVPIDRIRWVSFGHVDRTSVVRSTGGSSQHRTPKPPMAVALFLSSSPTSSIVPPEYSVMARSSTSAPNASGGSRPPRSPQLGGGPAVRRDGPDASLQRPVQPPGRPRYPLVGKPS